ncbi:MAG: CRISPR-associated endonuclease Cas2 [Candidatus Heimdallarchaeota archaeon]|nr:CRISPR-associated endonuclease Cas2 [Candidatus Heimdallarchaeota archaeon]
MRYTICYDIKEDDIRSSVSKLCKEAGLERIQYSVFFGELEDSLKKTLYLEIQQTIKGNNGNVHFIPACSTCQNKHRVLLSVSLDDEATEGVTKVEPIETQYKEISTELPRRGGLYIV